MGSGVPVPRNLEAVIVSGGQRSYIFLRSVSPRVPRPTYGLILALAFPTSLGGLAPWRSWAAGLAVPLEPPSSASGCSWSGLGSGALAPPLYLQTEFSQQSQRPSTQQALNVHLWNE